MTLRCAAGIVERGFDLEIGVRQGETLALLGPNGSGKSTLLLTLAGLLVPDAADISLGDRQLARIAEGRRQVWVPPHARNVGLLAQEARLFPHLSVLDNVAFGPRSQGASRRTARSLARTWLARVGLDDLAQRRPAQLSGGQAQRVAVARALAADPALLLLDEPFAALDVGVTPALRSTLGAVLADRTAVIATHDVLDALLLADMVAVIEDGSVVEQGPTREVLARPRSRFGASIAGLNLVSGTWDGSGVRTPSGDVVHGQSPDPQPVLGASMVAVFRPAAVAVYLDAVPGSPRNSFEDVVVAIEPYGDLFRVRGQSFNADVTPGAVADLSLLPGTRVWFVVKAAEVDIYPSAP